MRDCGRRRLFVPVKPSRTEIVSAAVVEQLIHHDKLTLWNHGALAGALVFASGEAERFALMIGLEEQLPA